MSGFVDRENQIFEILQAFKTQDLDYIVVGGYAVSAFQHRFSVDADLVIPDDNLAVFIEILEAEGFEEVEDRDVDVYGGRYLAYEKNVELPVTVDLFVNSLRCRQTDAAWSYEYFQQYSTTAEIEGSEQSIEVQIPEKALLIAVKLHSGRVTDARDAVALADDLDFENLEKHLERGNQDRLHHVLTQVAETITDDHFEDSFKGVFSKQTLPEDSIETLHEFLLSRT